MLGGAVICVGFRRIDERCEVMAESGVDAGKGGSEGIRRP